MDDDQIEQQAVNAVDAALATSLNGDMAASWVLVASVVLPDGSTGQWHLRSSELDLPHHMGLLAWAQAQCQDAAMGQRPEGDDDGDDDG